MIVDGCGAVVVFGSDRPNTSVRRRRAVVEEDLTASSAAKDTELATAAHTLIKLIEQQAPAAAAAIGVDLKDVSAANLRLADIAARGYGMPPPAPNLPCCAMTARSGARCLTTPGRAC